MLINELKTIEALMNSLINDTSLRKEAFSHFVDLSTFETTKMNLFNIMSINDLLETYNANPAFSLEYFLFKGIIPGLYEKPSAVPTVDLKFQEDVNSYYEKLVKALKEGNYTFDENNNVFVSSEEIETVIPPIWLYRLSNAFRKNYYNEMFLYNKKSENNILDRKGLIDYLRHTKTFLVKLSSANPNVNFKDVFANGRQKTIDSLANRKEIKVDDIIATFKSFVPDDVEIEISKYKLADDFWLIERAESYSPNFYNEPLEVQQNLINSWLLEFINSNEIANRQAQKYMLVSSLRDNTIYSGEDIPKNEVIVGLFNLYIKLINELDIDFTEVSLSDFRLDNYLSPSLQDNLVRLGELIKAINREHEVKVDAKEKVNNELVKLNALNNDPLSDKFILHTKRYQKALADYKEKEAIEDEHQVVRNQLQAVVVEEQKSSITNIAFDNEKIMALILEATKKGRVYIKVKGSSLYIELYNDTLGRNVFKSSISLDKLLEFISSVNLTLEDVSYTRRVS